MIVIVRIEVDDLTRRAIRRSKGEPGLATRAEVSSLVETCFQTPALIDARLRREAGRG